jgi:hypothetical protein
MDHEKIGAVWAAHDRIGDVVFIYDAEIRPRGDLAVLAATLRDKGKWIPVLFDHMQFDEEDGIKTADRLADLGVEIFTAPASREAAASEINIRLSAGRLKVFEHLEPWFAEYRRYRRDDKGELVTTDTHLIGATGLLLSHLSLAITEARAQADALGLDGSENYGIRDSLTGY